MLLVVIFGVVCQAQTTQDTLKADYLTNEVVQKLTNEELIDLIKTTEAMRSNQSLSTHGPDVGDISRNFTNPDFMRPVIISVIISVLLFIAIIISLPLYYNFRKTRSFHQMINGFTEKGQEIPKELILSVSQKRPDLHKAIILMATGVALSTALLVMAPYGELWALGIIPLIIGIGYFVTSRVVK